MSSLANIDVEALRYFISTLQSFNSDLDSKWGTLKSRWQASSDSWRDIKKDQFTGAVGWDDVIKMMEGYLATSEQYTTFLKRLEERAQSYLDA
jgi:hypothetical protein